MEDPEKSLEVEMSEHGQRARNLVHYQRSFVHYKS